MTGRGDAPASLGGIILVRHGETAWNRERRIMGNRDVSLSEEGRAQAQATAEMVARFRPDAIVTSPLARARETADILAAELDLAVDTDGDLEEVRYGDWTGKTYAEIAADPRFKAMIADPETATTPGGESIRDVQERGLRAVARRNAAGITLLVSHGDILRTIMAHYLCVPLRRFRRIRIDNCGVSAVSFADGDRPEVKFVNLLADAERAWDPLHWGSATTTARTDAG